MGAFSGMNDAKRGFVSNYLRKGRYIVRIDGCSSFEQEGKGRMWKNTLTILAVKDGDHKVGEEVHTFFTKDEKWPKMFFQKIMSFIAGVLDVEDSEIGEAETEEILGDENPMRGLVTEVTVVEKPSKKSQNSDGNPKMFSNYSWGPSMDAEEVLEAIGEKAVAEYFPSGL